MKQKKPAKSSGNSSSAIPEIGQIEELLQLMAEHNLEEFEYAQGDFRIRLRKPLSGIAQPAASAAQPPAPVHVAHAHSTTPAHPPAVPPTPTPAESKPAEDLHLIKSPIVGTYYGSASPGADAFVKVGAHVESGQTLCIVEAMKLMNEIESDASGEIVRVFVENGQPVEYGQPLFGIRPSRKK